MNDNKSARLERWQARLTEAETAYESERSKMDRRERVYLGDKAVTPVVEDDKTTKTVHVRNITSELIEAQVDSAIPQPKVTAMREGDEELAKLIEDMLRGELDRMNIEAENDMSERTTYIQGGSFMLVDWDEASRGGELAVTELHPKKVVPQEGVYTGIGDMDHIILKQPETRERIYRRYGVRLAEDSEEEPDVRGTDESSAPELVTQYIAYYRNGEGIGMFSWVGDTVLCDYEDYQARRLERCVSCGEIKTGEVCPICGGRSFRAEREDYETVYTPFECASGVIEASPFEPVSIPYYKPNVYPIVLRRNVPVYGRLLGESDVDKIESQQNTTNRISQKIITKLIKAGSYVTLPERAAIKFDTDDMKPIRLTNPADKNMIGVETLEGDISQDMAYLSQIYEEARQIIGITDSYQGRADTTATSKVAKEFAAKQSAGRLQSKRVVKELAYSELFEIMFKFMLAYADDERPVLSRDLSGNTEYGKFRRYDFLERDEAGNFSWNDRFLFSVDSSSPLAGNREAMWQETRMNWQTGAYGDPTKTETLVLFWSKMESLHYPDAGKTKRWFEERHEREVEARSAALKVQEQGLREELSMIGRSADTMASGMMQDTQTPPQGVV